LWYVHLEKGIKFILLQNTGCISSRWGRPFHPYESPLVTASTNGRHNSLVTALAVSAVFCRLLWRLEQSQQLEKYLSTPRLSRHVSGTPIFCRPLQQPQQYLATPFLHLAFHLYQYKGLDYLI